MEFAQNNQETECAKRNTAYCLLIVFGDLGRLLGSPWIKEGQKDG
jgi:hypothetical protein